MAQIHGPALSFDDVLIVPKTSPVYSRADISELTEISSLPLRTPILSANMSTITEERMAVAMAEIGGLGIVHRFKSTEDTIEMIYQASDRGTNPVGFSFGLGDEIYEYCVEAFLAGATVAVLDVAHADQKKTGEVLRKFFELFHSTPLIIGNVATVQAVTRLFSYIPTSSLPYVSFKVGIGSGSMCTTRIQTGCGMPTFQSIFDIKQRFGDSVTLIADGGIKTSGDIVKAIGAGASAVMRGRMLAGTDETPGTSGKKEYRGSASTADKSLRGEVTRNIEGEHITVPNQGPVARRIADIMDGVRSGISYAGFSSVSDFVGKAEFVTVTPNGHRESTAHGLTDSHS
jgi:IMP dehydrogenase